MSDTPKDNSPENMNDESRFGKRAGRYARVSGSMAGLAAKLAGERFFGLKIDRPEHAEALKNVLGNLKGPLMKIAQLLATIPEAIPPEYAMAFQELQSNAPPMGWVFVKRRMRSELGADWQDKFQSFEEDAAAAASLGQVHRAVLHDGQTVACKLQYPDMQSAIEADLKQLRLILSIFESYDKTISTTNVREEITARLHEELDYKREARFTKAYEFMLRDEQNVHVPRVIDDLSTERLLVTSWLDGEKILSFKDADLAVRNQIALNMFRAWYVPLYHYGIIHGDPHLGNYTIRPQENHAVNLLDFGCVRVFPPQFVQGVIDLYHALQRDDIEASVAAYEQWGFANISKELVEILNIWARFLYSAVLEDRKRVIGQTGHGVYGRETAQKVHAELRKVGTVHIPREFVFMDRAALGLGSVFIHLQAEINWYQLFNEMIDGFDAQKMQQKQDNLRTEFSL